MRAWVGILLASGLGACAGDSACKDATAWFEDRDGDGFGSDADRVVACEVPTGYTDNADDCDDRDAAVYPGATEVCGDGEVNACEGTAEEASASCALAAVAAVSDAASLDLSGEAAGDALGTSVAGVGDADGDGIPDALVGAPGAGGTGRVYLFWGTTEAGAGLGDAQATFSGESAGDGFGAVVAGAGDLNGDREGDLLLGAPNAGDGAGAFWVFQHEVSGELQLSDADAAVTGAAAGDRAGSALVGFGDKNGDGDPDVLIGAPGAASGVGAVYLLYGPLDGATSLADDPREFYAENAGAALGSAVASLDLDADGTPDLVMGAPTETLAPAGGETGESRVTGAFYTYRAVLSTPTSIEDADAKIYGEIEGDLFGGVLTNLGDYNGDGYDDLAVGAPSQNSDHLLSGSVYLVPGPIPERTYGSAALVSELQIQGSAEGDHAGSTVAAADLNGDGASDLIIGAPGDDTTDTDAGAVYTVLTPVSGNGFITDLASHQILGETAGDAVGSAVGAAGDLDEDGISELLIGAPDAAGGAGQFWLARLAGY